MVTMGPRQRGRIERFQRQYDRPRDAQAELLAALLRRNARTQFGREHGFATIRTPAEYQRRVPIRTWDEVAPYVDRILTGQTGVLTAEPPFFYHRTTGTIGKPKMIPVTRRCEALSAATHRQWVLKALEDNPRMLKRRVMAVLNTAIDGYATGRQAYGTVSGSIYFRVPARLRLLYAHPYDVCAIEDIATRRYALMRYVLDKSCSFAFTGNPMGLATAFEFAEKNSEILIRDIHDGTLAPEFPLPDALHAAALNDLKPNRPRARLLASVRARTGRLRPADYWPDLSLAGCWIGGSMGHFVPRLREWTGEVPFRDVGYMASEGIFSLPQANESVAGLPALHAVFFEFLPEHAFGKPDAPALLAHELEPGRNYQVIVTTTGGLYRYAMQDVIGVVGIERATPLIRFLYKAGQVQNLQGELMTVEHVMAALTALAPQIGGHPRHFQVVGDLDRRRYALHIEPQDALVPAALPGLLSAFDRALIAINETYGFFRADRLLNPPCLRLMRSGWLERITAEHMARSGRDAQFKPPVLVATPAHPDMVEQALDWPEEEIGERRVAGAS
jgi:hypothetical protein